MSEILFILFLIQVLIISFWCFKDYSRLLTVFSFFHFSYVGIILIGYFAIVFFNKKPFSDPVIWSSMLYAMLLHLAAFLGYNSRYRIISPIVIRGLFPQKLNATSTSIKLGLIYTIIGFYFFYLYYSLPEELLFSEHSGIVVLYLVFAKVLYVGYAILLEVSLRKNILFLKRIVFVIFLAILIMLTIRLKRTETLIFLSSTLFLLYHLKGFKLSRGTMLIGGSLFFLLVVNIGDLREIINVSFIKGENIEYSRINHINEKISITDKIIRAPELRWAISQMEVSYQNLDFSYGKTHWNRLINLFVPAQIVGSDVKEFFLMDVPKLDVYRNYGTEMFSTGLMNTVLAESFTEFWIFGIFFIYLLFSFLKSIVKNTIKYKFSSYIVFLSLVTPYAVTISGSGTSLFIGGSMFYYVYLLPLRYLK